jgi:hypothetical protein
MRTLTTEDALLTPARTDVTFELEQLEQRFAQPTAEFRCGSCTSCAGCAKPGCAGCASCAVTG